MQSHRDRLAKSARRWGRNAAATVFCLLWPSPCRLCGARLEHLHRLPVCPACLNGVAPARADGCRQCGDPTPALADDGRCLACHGEPPAFARALAACSYQGPARELILQLKFRGLRPAAAWWAERLVPLARTLPVGGATVVVPVPLGRRRQRERGYNQSGEIARRLARALRWEFAPHLLRRRRDTAPQSGLDRAARIRNLAGAFAAAQERVQGRTIVLIDDVLTTGATARAAASALRHAQAGEIYVLAAARAELEFDVPHILEAIA